MARALIVGIDSGIGTALAAALTRRGDAVLGTTRRPRHDGQIYLDLAAPDAAGAALPHVDVAIFCAAMARFAECRAEPERARRVNVEAPLTLARRLVGVGTRVVLLSTSAVFDGTKPRRHADEPTAPKSAYGRFKAEAERGFLTLDEAASVLRLSKMITPDMPLFATWAAALNDNRPIRAFADLWFCPIAPDDVVGALLAVIDDAGGGIYQVSGADDLSYAEAARHLAHQLGADRDLIETGSAADSGIPAAEILRHSSLDTSRLSRLTGFRAPSALSVLDAAWSPSRTAAAEVGR